MLISKARFLCVSGGVGFNSSVASYSSKFFDDNVLFLVQFSFRLNGRLSVYYLTTGPCMIQPIAFLDNLPEIEHKSRQTFVHYEIFVKFLFSI